MLRFLRWWRTWAERIKKVFYLPTHQMFAVVSFLFLACLPVVRDVLEVWWQPMSNVILLCLTSGTVVWLTD